MSKFVFILCAFLFAGAVCAEDVGALMKIKNEVVETAQAAYQNLNEKINAYAGPIKNLIYNLKKEAKNLRSTAYYQITNVEKQVMPKIDKVLEEAVGTDVKECANLAKAIKPLASETFKEADKCMTDLIDKAVNTWDNIYSQSKAALDNLVEVENEVEHCVEKIDDWRSAGTASICVTKVAAVGTWETATNVPGIIVDITDLYFQIKGFVPQLQICATGKAVQKVQESGEDTLKNVIGCVKAKQGKKSENSEKSWLRSMLPW